MTQPVSGSQGVDIPDDAMPHIPKRWKKTYLNCLAWMEKHRSKTMDERDPDAYDHNLRARLIEELGDAEEYSLKCDQLRWAAERALRDAETRGWNDAIEAAAAACQYYSSKQRILYLARPVSQSPEEGQ